MREALLRIAGIRRDGDRSISAGEWVWALSPLIAPFLILLCEPRRELLVIALGWAVFSLPGVLAINLWIPSDHPLGRGVARFAVAGACALLPFGIIAWVGCVVHWKLGTVMGLYAAAYATAVAATGRRLVRSGPAAASADSPLPEADESPDAPRWAGAVVLAGGAAMLVGLALACPQDPLLSVRRSMSPLLDSGKIANISPAFASRGIKLTPQASISAVRPDRRWEITDNGKRYVIEKERNLLNVYADNHHPWWHGGLLAVGGAVVAAAGFLAGARPWRRVAAEPAATGSGATAGPHRHSNRVDARTHGRPEHSLRPAGSMLEVGLASVLWAAAAVLTLFLMKVTYTLPHKELGNILPWNVDDVSYVSEAVDYRYGYPLGQYEPSIGSDHGLVWAAMSPLIAPLVAMFSRVTGIECPALHHGVMPPLMVLLGMSALAGALLVVFRQHRWLVPLGLIVALLMIGKSWHYERCLTEMVAYRAMQTKSVHLALLHPLQLATIVLILTRAGRGHTALGAVVGIVAHLVHPFASILGIAWSGAATGAALIWKRRALPHIVSLVAVYAALGGAYHVVSNRPLANPPASSGRVAGSPIQSRDLVRADAWLFDLDAALESTLDGGKLTRPLWDAFADNEITLGRGTMITVEEPGRRWRVAHIGQEVRDFVVEKRDSKLSVSEIGGKPLPQHDPEWVFGYDPLHLAGVTALPLVVALGWRRRELLYVGLIGVVAVALCHVAPLGRLMHVALPFSIMWRAKWMVPELVNLAIVASGLYWALAVITQRGPGPVGPGRALGIGVLVVGALTAALSQTTSRMLKPGAAPKHLTKFSDDMHELVELLGGVEAKPYVWGPFLVNHELCQLMPNIRLVMSRDKIMREAADPDFRSVVARTFNDFQEGEITWETFQRFYHLYPVEYVVVDHVMDREGHDIGQGAAKMLADNGWQRVGRAGRYEVWRAPARPAAAK